MQGETIIDERKPTLLLECDDGKNYTSRRISLLENEGSYDDTRICHLPLLDDIPLLAEGEYNFDDEDHKDSDDESDKTRNQMDMDYAFALQMQEDDKEIQRQEIQRQQRLQQERARAYSSRTHGYNLRSRITSGTFDRQHINLDFAGQHTINVINKFALMNSGRIGEELLVLCSSMSSNRSINIGTIVDRYRGVNLGDSHEWCYIAKSYIGIIINNLFMIIDKCMEGMYNDDSVEIYEYIHWLFKVIGTHQIKIYKDNFRLCEGIFSIIKSTVKSIQIDEHIPNEHIKSLDFSSEIIVSFYSAQGEKLNSVSVYKLLKFMCNLLTKIICWKRIFQHQNQESKSVDAKTDNVLLICNESILEKLKNDLVQVEKSTKYEGIKEFLMYQATKNISDYADCMDVSVYVDPNIIKNMFKHKLCYILDNLINPDDIVGDIQSLAEKIYELFDNLKYVMLQVRSLDCKLSGLDQIEQLILCIEDDTKYTEFDKSDTISVIDNDDEIALSMYYIYQLLLKIYKIGKKECEEPENLSCVDLVFLKNNPKLHNDIMRMNDFLQDQKLEQSTNGGRNILQLIEILLSEKEGTIIFNDNEIKSAVLCMFSNIIDKYFYNIKQSQFIIIYKFIYYIYCATRHYKILAFESADIIALMFLINEKMEKMKNAGVFKSTYVFHKLHKYVFPRDVTLKDIFIAIDILMTDIYYFSEIVNKDNYFDIDSI